MRRRIVGGGDPFYLKFYFGSTGPRWSEIDDFEPIIARSVSAVRPTERKKFTVYIYIVSTLMHFNGVNVCYTYAKL